MEEASSSPDGELDFCDVCTRNKIIAASALVLTLAHRRGGQGSNTKQPLGQSQRKLTLSAQEKLGAGHTPTH